MARNSSSAAIAANDSQVGTGASSAQVTFRKPEGMETSGSLEFIRPAKLAEEGITGVILEGVYVGTLVNKFNEEKPDYKFERLDGSTVVLNSAGNLAYQMNKIKEGTLTQISYLGKQKITKGKMAGKDSHNFEVLVG